MAESAVVRRSSRVRKPVSYSQDPHDLPVRSLKRTAQVAFEGNKTTPVPALEDSVGLNSVSQVKETAETQVHVKEEIPDDEPELSRLKPAKRTRRIKSEDHSDYESEEGKPKRRAISSKKKKKQDPNVPHVLVLKPGMTRPPGEKKLPMIYPVLPPSQRQARPEILAIKVGMFHETVQRMRDKIKPLAIGEKEVRLKPYVNTPSDRYEGALERAGTQRMYVLQRERSVEEHCHAHHRDCPVENFMVAGSTGNVYYVSISHNLVCSCADYLFRKTNCKHILYILHYVLKAPEHLRYQQAFLTSELREIAAAAPPMPLDHVKEEDKDGRRKPIEDDCPICCMEFAKGEEIVWCEASCGNNVHKECFSKWAAVKPGQVTCPFCRSAWHDDTTQAQVVSMTGVTLPLFTNQFGYMNVADQLGYP